MLVTLVIYASDMYDENRYEGSKRAKKNPEIPIMKQSSASTKTESGISQ